MVEKASSRFKLSWDRAMRDRQDRRRGDERMKGLRSKDCEEGLVPNTPVRTRRTLKTPTLTTATACSRALTGVGATMAAGSHE